LRPRILIVDDDHFIREVLTCRLRSQGYECAQTSDGKEAWKILETASFELLISATNAREGRGRHFEPVVLDAFLGSLLEIERIRAGVTAPTLVEEP